jgi:hypothetical protein
MHSRSQAGAVDQHSGGRQRESPCLLNHRTAIYIDLKLKLNREFI